MDARFFLIVLVTLNGRKIAASSLICLAEIHELADYLLGGQCKETIGAVQ